MKSIHFLAFLILFVHFQAKTQVLADFETSITTPKIVATEAKIIDNPVKNGNPSAKIVSYKKETGNWKYISFEFDNKRNIGQNDLLTFKIYSTTIGRVFAKFWDGNIVPFEQWAPEYNFKPDANKWVECKVDLSTIKNKDFTRLEIAVSVDNEAEALVYLDDLKLSNSNSLGGEAVPLLSVSKSIINVGESVDFDASKSVDYDGIITDYVWSFGDGTTLSGKKVTKVFTQSGNFKTTLTLTDNDKKVSRKEILIFVLPKNDKISQPFLLSAVPKVNQKVEFGFVVKDKYKNAFDNEEISIDAIVTLPDQQKITVPCFYFVKGFFSQNTWRTDTTNQYWMLRFSSPKAGIHTFNFKLTDKNGTVTSQEYTIDIQQDIKKGIIKLDPDNYQYYRHTSGQPYYPLGINVGWNSIQNYSTIINNLANAEANLVRFWQVPFNRQALEWKNDGYNKGIGVYSQEAAAISDSLFSLSESKNIYLQLVLFQHGMFSENVNSNWNDNPYNAKLGGPLTKAEEFFYNETAKKSVKKLLRYTVARWGYSSQLFAWELFNEVQFTGIHPNQSAAWKEGILSWHNEMGKYIKSIDPFKHIITTSAEDKQLLEMDKLEGLDVVQYHLYDTKLLDAQNTKDEDFKQKLSRTAIINGEYGLDINTADVPFETQRISIWTGIMNQVPHLMWLWDNYTKPEWANLFKSAAVFLKDKDFVKEGSITNFNVNITNYSSLSARGFKSSKRAYVIIYDGNGRDDLSGVGATFYGLKDGKYKIIYTDILSGKIQFDSLDILAKNSSQVVNLPTFSKGIVVELEYMGEIIEKPLAIDSEEHQDIQFNVYPNPSKGTVIIDYFTENYAKADIVISDLFGKVVHGETLSLLPKKHNEVRIELHKNLGAGLYLITLKVGNSILSRKIILSN
ncbi:PKD domain-containing protein [Arcicella sp. LKC2W]|uniref:PKD domain-containing protein n=1 Tax=Arcicella sp. LKC2W TaxID=2984198 RepID=UPI002B204621|nr:PKD domain-containing protein [Arcicella sp. LKC2W]MEA5461096.1 PKD domain-containing protein [Arcicella sp. LKC2W]